MVKEQLRVIAHRCRGFGEPENSLPALKKALASNVDAVEIDYRISKDGKLVCYHPPFYKTKGKRHWISTEPAKTAQKNKLMLLDEAFAVFKKYGKGKEFQVDIKWFGGEKELVRLIKKHGIENNILVVSWMAKSLETIHALAPELRLSYSFPPKVWTDYKKGLPRWFAFRLPVVIRKKRVPLESVNLVPRLFPVSRWLIKRLNARDIDVVVVNVDDLKGNERLRKYGVCGSMTNKPRLLLEKYGK